MLKEILINEGIKFENDKIAIGRNIKRIKFDIGISTEAIHTEDWLNKQPNDLLVFGFDALPQCIEDTKAYFSQPISKWKHTTNSIDTKWLNTNFMIIPVALGPTRTDNVPFFVTSSINVGCSSLLKPTQVLANIGITVDKIINVPMCPLSDFFELLPLDSIEYIEYIKVDVQGTDLEVIKSGGKYISDKVVYVTMEAETTQYELANSNNVDNMKKYMESIGFKHVHHPNTYDATFLNKKFEHLANDIYISQFN